jgi:hypothetical protein
MSFNYHSNSKHYDYTPKDNPKDRIQVEIGDADNSTDFFPKVKIKRWDGEVYAGIRLIDTNIPGNTSFSDDGTKITWIKKQGQNEWKAVFYDKPDASDEGGFEFEVWLPAKPPQNYIQFQVDNQNLDWFYQPPLTQEEIDQGAQRPENVVGSYAVYHKTKGGMNDAVGMEYKAGKAFHVYRPHVVDSNNNETWGTLSLDEQTGILTISVDQTWLNNAVYPVVVDPTFGYTSVGGTPQENTTERIYYQKFALPEAGTIESLSQHTATPTYETTLAIYDDSATANLLAQTDGFTPSADTWNTENLQSSYSASADDYILYITKAGVSFMYDSSSDKYAGWNNNTYPHTPSTQSLPDELDWNISIYATYTASASDLSVSASSPSTLSDSVTANENPLSPNNISASSTSTLSDSITSVGGNARTNELESNSTATDSITIRTSAGIASVASTSTLSDSITSKAGNAVSATSSTSTISDSISATGGVGQAATASTSTLTDTLTAERVGEEVQNLNVVAASTSTAQDVLPPWYSDGVYVQDQVTTEATSIIPNNVSTSSISTLADAILAQGGDGQAHVGDISTIADAILANTSGDNYAVTSSLSTVSDSITAKGGDAKATVSSTSTLSDQVLVNTSGDNYALASSISTLSDAITSKGGNAQASVQDTTTITDTPTVSAIELLLSIAVQSISTLTDQLTSVGGAGQASVQDTSTLADSLTTNGGDGQSSVTDTSTITDALTVDAFDVARNISVTDTCVAVDVPTWEKAGVREIVVVDGFGQQETIYMDDRGHMGLRVTDFFHLRF